MYRLGSGVAALLLSGVLMGPAAAAEPVVPQDSGIGRAATRLQRLLLSPLAGDATVVKAGWRLGSLTAEPAPGDTGAKLGGSALRLAGRAEVEGAKGDFAVV